MKRKWSIWLSLLVLLLNFIPNLLFGYKVVADTIKEHQSNIQLISQDNLKLSYNMKESPEKYIWEISYQFNEPDTNKTLRLNLNFNHDQAITLTPDTNNWESQTADSLVSKFLQSAQGQIQVISDKSITSLSLKVQADSKTIINGQESVQNNALGQDIGKSYDLFIPQAETAPPSSSTSSQPATTVASTEQPTVQSSEATPSSSSVKAEVPLASVSQPTVQSSEPVAPTTETSQTNGSQLSLKQTSSLTTYPSNFSIQSALVATSYTNISPVYTTNSTGIYPSNSWVPTSNSTVINHQGNKNASSVWDGITSWSGDPTNRTTSYIEYGGTGANADFAIRKFAKETTTPGLYDVYLNVRGNVQKTFKPVDIVLVVDMSGSMEPNRAPAVRSGVQQFLQTIQNANLGQYVNVGLVGFSSPGNYSTGSNGYDEVAMHSLSTTGQVTALNNAIAGTFSGGTFTQLGIRQGVAMLQADTSSNPKMMILLTDGVPTYSYHVTGATSTGGVIYGTTFNTTMEGQGNTSKLSNSYNVNSYSIADTFAATLGEARLAKNNGVEIRTLGIQLANDGTYLTAADVRTRMSNLASTGLYQDADTATAITAYLNAQAQNVVSSFNTIVNGSISDPLGAQFIYNGSSATVSSVGTTAVTPPAATIANNQLTLNNLNLGQNQEIQIHYQVRLNTETSDFIPNYWYQMNGRSTLTPNASNPTNMVDFGIPSAKGAGVSLTFNKIWEEYDGDASSRPTSVTYQVGRTATSMAGAWQQAYVNVTGSNTQATWTQVSQQLAAQAGTTATLWLPKYNTQGQAFVYSVTNEAAVPGYTSTQTDSMSYKNVKQFIPLSLVVNKVDETGKPISGAQFKLTNEAANEILGVISNSGTTFTYANLAVGKYYLQETKAPLGYALLSQQILIEVLANGTVKVNGQLTSLTNHVISLTVKNQPAGMLPTTGGSGPVNYWISGSIIAMLFLLVATYYFFMKKRKNEAAKEN